MSASGVPHLMLFAVLITSVILPTYLSGAFQLRRPLDATGEAQMSNFELQPNCNIYGQRSCSAVVGAALGCRAVLTRTAAMLNKLYISPAFT